MFDLQDKTKEIIYFYLYSINTKLSITKQNTKMCKNAQGNILIHQTASNIQELLHRQANLLPVFLQYLQLQVRYISVFYLERQC